MSKDRDSWAGVWRRPLVGLVEWWSGGSRCRPGGAANERPRRVQIKLSDHMAADKIRSGGAAGRWRPGEPCSHNAGASPRPTTSANAHTIFTLAPFSPNLPRPPHFSLFVCRDLCQAAAVGESAACIEHALVAECISPHATLAVKPATTALGLAAPRLEDDAVSFVSAAVPLLYAASSLSAYVPTFLSCISRILT